MNGKETLTLDFKTFTASNGLDYAKDKYVSHHSTEEVKAELAKIVDNLILLDRTPVLKTAFPVAWKIMALRLQGHCLKRKENLSPKGHPLRLRLDDGTRKSQPLPEGTTIDPKDSGETFSPLIGDCLPWFPMKVRLKPHHIDDEEVVVAGEDMDEDNQADEEEHHPKLKKYDNILLLTKRQLEDTSLKKKVVEATEAYLKNSTHLAELLTLIKKFHFQRLKSSMESLQATALSQDKHLAEWAKLSTSIAWNLGPRMTDIENSQAIIRTKVFSLSQDTSDIKSMMT
nr:hypothetical protein [Tanacetum cinerariifolium]